MSKANEKATEAAKRVIDRMTVQMGPDFDQALSKIDGDSLDGKVLKAKIDEMLAKRAAALSEKLYGAFRMAHGL
ncbi:MAG: hypothetical protein BWY99_00344 [Synergistetes bacterium ADurb.BinA166]|nr:MAG: hypothetical protein BWY99_00344 [Synergistetes bacterium ADurb.BinA166]